MRSPFIPDKKRFPELIGTKVTSNSSAKPKLLTEVIEIMIKKSSISNSVFVRSSTTYLL
jgi:hypothetical protein